MGNRSTRRACILGVAASLGLLCGITCGGGGGGGSTTQPATAPGIITQPVNATVIAGQPASFSVTATGTAPLSYQWKKDGVALANATSTTYAIAATAASDAGSYVVTVTNAAGSVDSSAATLTVNPAAPSITAQPASATVTAGQPASFSVTATGTQPFTYTWYVNGSQVSESTDTLAFTPASLSDSGKRIKVEVGNAAGKATSQEATLTVNRAVGINTGCLAPVFAASTWDGKKIDLPSLNSKYVLLCFQQNKYVWTGWLNFIELLYKKYKNQNLEVITIITGNNVNTFDAETLSKTYSITHYIIADTDGSLSKLYSINMFPSNFIIDNMGIIATPCIGAVSEYFNATIPLYLNNTPCAPYAINDINNISIKQNGGDYLSYFVISNPPAEIHWLVNDKIINCSGSCCSLENPLNVNNGDRVRAEAQNKFGSISSSEGTVFVDPNFGGQTGNKASEFYGTTWDGHKIQLDGYKNKNLMLTVIDSGCGFSKSELSYLDSLYQEYSSKGVEFVVFVMSDSGPNSSDLKNIVDTYKLSFPVISSYYLSISYQINSFPSNFVIDRSGTIQARIDGDQKVKIRAALDAITAAADYSMSVTPVAIAPGQSGSAPVAITRAGGHSAALTLSVDTNAQGITGSGTVAAGADAGALNLAVPQGVAAGTYALRMSATDGTLTRSATFNLVVGSGVTLDLSIPKLYITQATQTLAGDVPLVQGVDGVLRAFVVANMTNTVAPAVRVRLYAANDTLLQTYTIPAPKAGVPTWVDESHLDTSWNLKLPGTYLQSGCKILADVDPASELLETDRTNNTWPANGTPQALDVRTVQPFRITFVPITTGDGRTGSVDAASMASFTSLLEKVWPVGPTVDRTLAPQPFTVSDILNENDTSGWSSALNKLDAKRVADGFTGHYYGVVSTAYSSGTVGMGLIGAPTAMGWDRTDGVDDRGSNAGTCAHEVGHNFGLYHAPCGGAASPDPAFPYAGGTIGAWGLDPTTLSVKDPSQWQDLMGYCAPVWVSDYNYKKVLQSRAVAPATTQASVVQLPGPSLLLWGRLDRGQAVLEPAFHLPNAPQLPESGDQLLEGFDALGQRLFTTRFALHALGDQPDVQAFAFSIPLDGAQLARLCSLRWIQNGQVMARRDEQPTEAAMFVQGTRPIERQELSDGRSRILWDGHAQPMVLVRDPATGHLLGIGSGGDFRLKLPAGTQEFYFSTGVRSHMLCMGRTE